ncbi:MAG: NADH-quinone oxidoreductase subunit I [Candidatus Schekmanbacteria bacterium]|nr:MAG: NADH-quinone oxidoreductase subunit I [Candidatus Schekmanbacteria bacterium]
MAKTKIAEVEEKNIVATIKGLAVTIGNFATNLFKKDRPTIEYPDEKREYSERVRGVHILTKREDGSPKCVACYMCATICPAQCITIVAEEHPDDTIEKRPKSFEIDMLRCVFCGYCVDACPEEAIIMSNEIECAFYSYDERNYNIDILKDRPSLKDSKLGYRPDKD